jgi:hypothetical protein
VLRKTEFLPACDVASDSLVRSFTVIVQAPRAPELAQTDRAMPANTVTSSSGFWNVSPRACELRVPTPRTRGNAERDLVREASIWQLDISLPQRVPRRECEGPGFRNLLDPVQLGLPVVGLLKAKFRRLLSSHRFQPDRGAAPERVS